MVNKRCADKWDDSVHALFARESEGADSEELSAESLAFAGKWSGEFALRALKPFSVTAVPPW